jgi:bacillithiol system protein YtxJ
MEWIMLTEEGQLQQIKEQSRQQAIVIFKHSTRCSISALAKIRLEREPAPKDVSFYYLDLLKFRPISNKIAEEFHVHHESPQVLVIKDGSCTYEDSHNGINMQDIAEQVS